MPLYTYKGIDKSGKKVSGRAQSPSKEMVAENLLHSGTTIMSLEEVKGGLELKFIDDFLKKMAKVRINDMVMFTLQLSNMLDAGMPLPAALSTLSEQTENQKLKEAVTEVSNDIKQGKTFSEALAKHKDMFSNLFVNMVAAGEVSGNLDQILARLATFMEHEAELRQKISSAMTYPIILVVAGVGVVSFVVTSVLPPFVKIFQDANVPLPFPTLVLYELNLFLRGFWPYLLVAGIAGWIFFQRWVKTPEGKAKMDTFKMKVPAWGDLARKVEIARLSRTLAALLTSGVPMLQALQVTEKTIDLAPIAQTIKNVGIAVGKGKNISDPLRESGQFPPMPIHMIAVGEETGTLEVMLNKVADFYDLATEYSIKKLTALMEPMFLVVIGGMVGFIFASILLPIFNMAKTLKQ